MASVQKQVPPKQENWLQRPHQYTLAGRARLSTVNGAIDGANFPALLCADTTKFLRIPFL